MASSDLESPPVSYSPLPSSDRAQPGSAAPRRTLGALCLAVSAALLLALAAAVLLYCSGSGLDQRSVTDPVAGTGRGVREGVSSKSTGAPTFLKSDSGAGAGEYAWTNTMLSWQRTGFHFQPIRNWMNDPNGPMFYNGWYHLFYQYNPKAAVWDTISWGHAISRDLLNWIHLPVALSPDKWYDSTGVWSGSATVLPDGQIYMLYTGGTDELVQLQNVAVPSNLSDPFLIEWEKIDVNPIMNTPPGVGPQDFRDPSTAWYEHSDSTWRVAVGSLNVSSHSGIGLVYSTKDFHTFTRLPGTLHAVERVGMWECIDFYPIAISGSLIRKGLDSLVSPSQEIKYVLKASTQDDNSDYYAIGTYDPVANKWTPDDDSLDVGVGLKYNWGKFYASKSFYDQKKQRRILWGWVAETDTERADISKGWASLQGIPRTILFDMKTRSNLLTWPIEEVESLRVNGEYFEGISVGAGSTFELLVGSSSQLDIEAEFEVNKEALDTAAMANVETYDCITSGGAATRGIAGPFGLLVLANEGLTEQTAVYFYISKGSDGNLKTHFCQDESRSSKANDVVKRVVGHTVPVLEGETLALRVLVDHSIVESFAQGGRASATSRIYPTEAIYNAARVLLFNNATGATLTAKTLKVWQMQSTDMQTLHLPN